MEVLVEVLADVLGTSPGDLEKEIKSGEDFKSKSDIQKIVKAKFSDKVGAIKRDASDEGYGRAKREVLTELEKKLATDYEVDKSGNIEEVIKAVIAKKSTQTQITADDIRASEIYQNDLKKVRDKLEKTESDLGKITIERKTEKVSNSVNKVAQSLLTDNNFVLPENEKMKAFQLNTLLEKVMSIDGGNIDLDDKGNPLVLAENGKPKMDEVGNPIKFEDHFLSLAKLQFVQAKSDDRKSPENKPGEGGGKQYSWPSFNNQEEYMMHLNEKITDLDEKRAFVEAHRGKF